MFSILTSSVFFECLVWFVFTKNMILRRQHSQCVNLSPDPKGRKMGWYYFVFDCCFSTALYLCGTKIYRLKTRISVCVFENPISVNRCHMQNKRLLDVPKWVHFAFPSGDELKITWFLLKNDQNSKFFMKYGK